MADGQPGAPARHRASAVRCRPARLQISRRDLTGTCPTEAHELAVPGLGHVRCAHQGIVSADSLAGRTLPSGPAAQRVYFVELTGDELLASVEQPEGETILQDRHHQPLVKIRWAGAQDGQWGECELSALEMLTVDGALLRADGSPATGESVVTCPGEIRTADEHGEFSFHLPRGVTCHPMGFIEGDDGSFGRGPPAEVTGGVHDEVVVTMPGEDDIWSLDQQRMLLRQLATMLSDAEDRREGPLAQLADLADASPEARSLIAAWAAQVSAARDSRYTELEFLLGPDAGPEDFKDAWLIGVGM